jgi:glucose/arabinose dehydrogenase
MIEEPFLDIRDKVIKQENAYTERGLLGIAFHPHYRKNRKFYLFYSAPNPNKEYDNRTVVAEYRTLHNNPEKTDPNSERIILEIDDPESNHNGGQLLFGADGYLYIGIGDGGGQGDEHGQTGNGQNLETLMGKILRIDVNTRPGKGRQQYRIPPDNPFVGKPGRDEIWAYGFRNPWKFSIDKRTGLMFCADVGQDKWEEVDIVRKGRNYGWRIMEGNHCYYSKTNDCEKAGLEMPIAEYGHDEGQSILGGHVYNGSVKSMQGKYFFADWTGKLFILSKNADDTWKREQVNWARPEGKVYINSMGENQNGDLYLLMQQGLGPEMYTGMIYKIIF